LLGYIIEADGTFLEKNPDYRPGDYIGRTGLEEYYEPWLKGEKGYSIYLRDVHNQIKSSYEEGDYDKPAVPGKNMVTSIDLPLQAFGEELMKNKVGSVIALDPSSGEVLTLITSTGLSTEYLTNFGAHYSKVISDPLKPMFNRAIMSSYPPGSVFKLVNGLIGLQEDVVTPNTRYSCNMGYRAGSLTVGCHSHPSPLNLMQSVMMSCNAYYCYVFRNILDNPEYENTATAMDVWQEYVKSFGFGQKLGIDIPGELPGSIPGSVTYNRIYGTNAWRSLTVISLSIGQGEIGATPLQLANLAAVMANRGHYYTPHLVREIPEDPGFRPAVERHQVMVILYIFQLLWKACTRLYTLRQGPEPRPGWQPFPVWKCAARPERHRIPTERTTRSLSVLPHGKIPGSLWPYTLNKADSEHPKLHRSLRCWWKNTLPGKSILPGNGFMNEPWNKTC
jgi:penicillin-binding protein 2